MKQYGEYPYRVWKSEVLKHLQCVILPTVTEKAYPTVDFKHIYRAVPDPLKAAEVVKAVHIFTKDEYKTESSYITTPSKA